MRTLETITSYVAEAKTEVTIKAMGSSLELINVSTLELTELLNGFIP